MFSNSGYVSDGDIDEESSDAELLINSCGEYRLLTLPRYETVRPEGRRDYQLLYVAGGKASFTVQDTVCRLTEGYVFFYRPGEVQHYSYEIEDRPDIFWLHYSGKDAEEFTSALQKPGQEGCFVGIREEYRELFCQIIRELQLRRSGFRRMAEAYARQLLLMMARDSGEAAGAAARNRQIEQVIQMMHQEYSLGKTVEEYARECSMGTCWFIRSFRKATGVSPQQFLIRLRIGKARELLAYTSYNISEIAALAGYENPLYFSRLFRKNTGISPTRYREMFAGKIGGNSRM